MSGAGVCPLASVPCGWHVPGYACADGASPYDYPAPAAVALLVGPEGGFSDAEVEQAISAGFAGLTLGPRVLRTETAALAALSVFQFQWGDF